MECPVFDTIYISWNNELSPSQLNLLENKHIWKNNVVFIHTDFIDNVFLTPSWMEEDLILTLDNHHKLNCRDTGSILRQWNDQSYALFGASGTNYLGGIIYQHKNSTFEYKVLN